MSLDASSSSAQYDASVGSDQLTTASSMDAGTCSYFAPQSDGCALPRPCVDCLNFNVAAETVGCMVNAVGKCVSVTGNYDSAHDFRKGQAANSVNGSSSAVDIDPLLFRASDAQYCEPTDAGCLECRSSVFLQPSSRERSTFCYGANGCVCIAACESTSWSEAVGGKQCSSGSSSSRDVMKKPFDGAEKPHGMAPWEITLVAIAVLLVVLICVILFKRQRDDQMPQWLQKMVKKFRKQSPEQATTNTPVAAVAADSSSSTAVAAAASEGGPKREGLSLFGWRGMREELIDNENHRLARVDEDRSPAAGFVQFADTTPSAPAFDEDQGRNVSTPTPQPSAPSHHDL